MSGRPISPQATAAPLAPAVLGKNAKSRAVDQSPEAGGPTKWQLQTLAAKIVSDDRIRWCLRNMSFVADGVEIRVAKDKSRASYHGLQTCGSVWACPVCAAKIAEKRREELLNATTEWKEKKAGGMVLGTFTVPHQKGDQLPALVSAMMGAQARIYRQDSVRKVLQGLGIVGRVRALEVTHGRFGWHPHVHVIFFSDHVLNDSERVHLNQVLSNHWRRAVVAEGLNEPDAIHGVDIRDGCEAAAYASKWGIESEVTRLHTKKGTDEKGATPFDLLRRVAKEGMKSAAVPLFRTYAGVFKGKRQLYWSKGLRARLGLTDEKPDAVVAAEPEEEHYTAAVLTPWQWRCVYALELRGHLLEWCRRFGPLMAFEYLDAACAAASMHAPPEQIAAGTKRRPDPGDPLDFKPNQEAAIRAAKAIQPMTDDEDLFEHAPALPKLFAVIAASVHVTGAVALASINSTGAIWCALVCLVLAVPVCGTIATMPKPPKGTP